MDALIAERELVLIDAGGERRPVRLCIHQPQEVAERTWTCQVVLDGLEDRCKDTIGVDSWQALTVAVAVIRQTLACLFDNGARLCEPQDGSDVTLDDLFPHFD